MFINLHQCNQVYENAIRINQRKKLKSANHNLILFIIFISNLLMDLKYIQEIQYLIIFLFALLFLNESDEIQDLCAFLEMQTFAYLTYLPSTNDSQNYLFFQDICRESSLIFFRVLDFDHYAYQGIKIFIVSFICYELKKIFFSLAISQDNNHPNYYLYGKLEKGYVISLEENDLSDLMLSYNYIPKYQSLLSTIKNKRNIIRLAYIFNNFVGYFKSNIILRQFFLSAILIQNMKSQAKTEKTSLGKSPEKEEVILFQKKLYYPEDGYYETKSKNLISKKCLIKGSDFIDIFDHAILQDKLILRADLAKISVGRYVILTEGVIVKPPYKRHNGQMKFIPVQIGNHVFIDKNTIVQAMKVGSYTRIGRDCIIGQRTLIGQCVLIQDGSIVPPDSSLAPYSVYGGKPALYIGELPQSASVIQKQATTTYFNNFIKKSSKKG